MNQFLRDSFFGEDAGNHGAIPSGAGEAALNGAMAAAGEVVDITQHCIIHHQRQRRRGGFHFVLNFVLNPWIHRESHGQNVVERGLVETGHLIRDCCAHSGQILAVNGIDHLLETGFVKLLVGGIVGSGQHQVDGCVEIRTRVVDVATSIELAGGAKLFFRLLNQNIRSRGTEVGATLFGG